MATPPRIDHQLYAKRAMPIAPSVAGRAYRQRDAGLASVQVDHLMRDLRGDPRWRRLLERLGFASRPAGARRTATGTDAHRR
jgi:hypothetical protein